MSDERFEKDTHSVSWGCDDGRDVVCYATGTEAEAERCRNLLRELRHLGGDDRFKFGVRELSDEEYAEEIVDLEAWEVDPEDLDGIIERLQTDIGEALEEAKQAAENEIDDLDDEIVDLTDRINAKKAAIAD